MRKNENELVAKITDDPVFMMMQRGKPQVRVIDLIGEELRSFVEDAGMIPVTQLGRQAVDFIKRNPVFDDVFVTLKQNPAEIQIIVDAAPVGPAVAFLRQRERIFIVIDRNQRLDPRRFQLGEHAVIERQTGFVGFTFIAVGENPRPVDGHAEDIEAHFLAQRDILLIMMIEIDSLMTWIEVAVFVDHRGDPARFFMRAVSHDVGNADALAFGLPGPLALVGRRSSAPEEVFRKAFQLFHWFTPFL